MIKVNYNETTGEILGYYPNDFGYETIPEPYIEITEAEHLDCINNQGLRRVESGKIVQCEIVPVLTPEPIPVEYEEISPIVLNMAETMAALNERIAKLEGQKLEGGK